uniref:Uncharacterized protein n=1 Tax=Anguilla anguilla TaxID=7936 RepID=A0A0E9UH20_ANGAN
MNYCTEGIYF